MNNTRVSICIPTYNGAKYIAECLESVCNQTVTDYEIIVCDDGSTDNTIELVKSVQEKDSRIKLNINKQNLGLSGNWNRCIELAQGEWIKFVFQDDLVMTDCLEQFLRVVNSETQLIVCERDFIFEKELDKGTIHKYNRLRRLYQYYPGESAKDISAKDLCCLASRNIPGNFIGEPSSIMFTRKSIKELGEFNGDIVQLMDLEFILRVGVNYGLIYIPQKLVQFRVHNSSASLSNTALKYFSIEFCDRVALVYILLNDTRYVNFRKFNSRFYLLKTKIYMYYKTHRAHKFIYKNNNDPALLQEFNELCKLYKGVDKYANSWFLFLPFDIIYNLREGIFFVYRLLKGRIDS